MKIEALDHVALWVRHREVLAGFLCESFRVHEIERTEKFTLIGADARRGKLTIFDAEGEREPGVLDHVAFRVVDLERALAQLPTNVFIERVDPREAQFSGPEGLGLGLVERSGEFIDYDIDHVTFAVRDPEAVRTALLDFGFTNEGGRLYAGGAGVELVQAADGDVERPLFNHVGLRVESAADHIAEAERLGLEIADIVDAENTYAVFVWGPERIKLEYVEHKETFALR